MCNTLTFINSDVDECTRGLHNCDSVRQDCTNTQGGFTCSCKSGFTLVSGACKDVRLISTSGHTQLSTSTDFTPYIFPDFAYPVGNDAYPAIYATNGGLLLFSTITFDERSAGQRRSFTNPTTFSIDSSFEEKAGVAGYWANMNISDSSDSTTGVYYKLYQDTVTTEAQLIQEISTQIQNTYSVTFIGRSMVVVTWNKLQYPQDSSQTVTFQIAVITDYNNTYAKVLYGDGLMTWNIPFNSIPNYPVRVGYLVQSDSGATVKEYTYSYLDIQNSANEQNLRLIQNIDTVTSSDYSNTDPDIKLYSTGQFFFKLSSNANSYDHTGITCDNWITADRLITNNTFTTSDTQICPCTSQQVLELTTYEQITGSARIPSGVTCYTMINNPSQSVRCCYDTQGAIITDHISANGSNTYRRFTGQQAIDDDNMYDTCCNSDNFRFSKNDMCSLYLIQRPVCTCTASEGATIGAGFGDPHFATLDSLQFTFNGHGEFYLLKANNFELQARLVPYVSGGVDQPATIVSSMVAKQHNPVSDTIEFRLNTAKTDIEILRNSAVVTPNLASGSVQYTEVTISKTTVNSVNTYLMTFSGGVQTGARVIFNMIQPVFTIISSWKGLFIGLLGNFNGNRDDDFTDPDGNALSAGSNATEEEIYTYGLKWQNNETNSLFTYDNSNTWNTYVDANFTPSFFNSNLTAMFPNDTVRQEAQDTCYIVGQTDPDPVQRRVCYFDYMITGDTALAQSSSNTSTQVQQSQQILSNDPPTIQNANVTLQVTVGQSYNQLLVVNVLDVNGDNVFFYLNSDAPSGLTIDNTTKTLSWNNVADLQSATINIFASDGMSQSVLSTKIELCKCQNGGTCDFSATSANSFLVVPCICPSGYDGSLCESDKDGCRDKPCYGDVTCTDVPASLEAQKGTTFQCDACPINLVGDGQTCADQNECLTSPCGHNCTNLAGGYQCTCLTGYYLGQDGKACSDINECAVNSGGCDTATTTCVNTEGSFTCNCLTGYKNIGYSTSCVDINECSQSTDPCPANSRCSNNVGSYVCLCNYGYVWNAQTQQCDEINECLQQHNCEQVCVDGAGLYTCSCNTGYRLSNDTVSCYPASECSVTEDAMCDGGNSTRAKCAIDTVNGGILCQCNKGYVLNSTNYCQDINECNNTNLCSSTTSTCVNTDGSYYCQCNQGYSTTDNYTCNDVNECTASTHNCSSPATCVNNDGGYTCQCPSGYTLNSDQISCDNINECASSATNPCDKENGNCTDTVGSVTCACNTGYTGTGYYCSELNECTLSDRGGCQQGCRNTIGSYECFCGSGFSLNADGRTCSDVDECSSTALNKCSYQNYCTNTNGSFTCGCPANFTLKGDGITCESIYSCASGNNCSYACGKINGVDTCTCQTGHTLDSSGLNCIDIQECNDSSLHDCNATNNVQCRNLVGSYECVCTSDQYIQIEQGRCTDKDECLLGTHGCPQNSKCSNLVPGFECVCLAGFTKVGSICQDVNECVTSSHGCHGNCTNTEGGFTCACQTGYSGDGVNCQDVNECTAGTHTCDKRTDRGLCTNNVGSFTCSCASGYQLAQDQQTCEDVDECVQNTDGCEYGCVNIAGGFYCTCPTGFSLTTDQKTCAVAKECNATVAAQCTYKCAMINGNDTCTCPNGFQLASDSVSCQDINECTSSSPPCDATNGNCTNTNGSFACACLNGYILGAGYSCTDRNGVWSDWGQWSTCTLTCGTGQQTRTRTCSNPAKAGNGLDCQGSGSETQNCNTNACQATADETRYGVLIQVDGMTVTQFTAITTSFEQTVANLVNTYCNYNASNVQTCCGTTTNYVPDPNSPKEFTTSSNVVVGGSYLVDTTTGFETIVIVKYSASNALCAAASGVTTTRRRKRATGIVLQNFELALSQATLQSILNQLQSQLQSEMVLQSQNALGQTLNITIQNIIFVTTTSTTTTTTTTTTQPVVQAKPGQGVQSWVIAIAVVSAIIGLLFIVVIALVIIKLNVKNKITPMEPRADGEGAQ